MPCSCRVTCSLLWCWWRFCWFVRVCGIMRFGRGGLECIFDLNLALVGASGALCGLMSVVPMAVWSALGANANIEEIAHCCRQACCLVHDGEDSKPVNLEGQSLKKSKNCGSHVLEIEFGNIPRHTTVQSFAGKFTKTGFYRRSCISVNILSRVIPGINPACVSGCEMAKCASKMAKCASKMPFRL